ncbi:DNA ligase 3-like [Babylonia areolata]|uniref:DNA ligase 3-like n=1 Tax=Babylonia areolata TaxID=304850 RepID=UPI003FD35BB2
MSIQLWSKFLSTRSVCPRVQAALRIDITTCFQRVSEVKPLCPLCLHREKTDISGYSTHLRTIFRTGFPRYFDFENRNNKVYQSLPFLHRRFYSSMADNRYVVGYAKLGTSSCKKCKQKIDKGGLRIGKVVANPFGDDGGDMKQWFHPSCIFETFLRARATTKKIEEPDDMEGFGDLQQEDKNLVNQLIDDFQSKSNSTPKKKKPAAQTKLSYSPSKVNPSPKKAPDVDEPSTSSAGVQNSDDPNIEKDNSFRQFRRLCADIADENSYTGKTQLVQNYINKGHSGSGYQGDLYLLLKLLLPGVVKTVYNLNNKQLVKLFSQIFGTDLQEMIEDLDQGDVAETVRVSFESSKLLMPAKKSALSLQEVDALLTKLSQFTKEEDQQRVLTKIAVKCTANDLKMVIRLIKHDLRINAGAKHILDGLDPNAYAAFQASRDLRGVVERVVKHRVEARETGKPGLTKSLSIKASLMTPVLPMLAEACKSVEYAFKKCPNGIFAEIKYDGERVQVHKRGSEFRYFSRSLKPVLAHKVAHFKDYIPKAFPTGNDLILDAEVLLVDTNTGNPLPFGTLGVHKKAAFTDAKVCLFVFDCLLINDNNLMEKTMKERRQILEKNMSEVEHRVMLSEVHKIKKGEELQKLMNKVFDEGLEGLVLKDASGIYEPGKRHWLKVKKDYLHEGSMADSADLIVLGAYYGTGNKGGLMSIFLMGCYDPGTKTFCTVSKCGNGLDDKTLDQLQTQLDMVKISKDPRKVPAWLSIKKQVVPDFVVADPKKAPVWEIIGAEFSKAEIHTADGISIRFPRIQKFRDDKTWKEATDLPRLQTLYKESKRTSDLEVGPSTSRKGGDDSDGGEGGAESDGDMNGTSGSTNSSPRKGVKRGAGDTSPESSPAKKSKPSCKYGADCYQTSQTHRDKFYHPPKSSSKASEVASPAKGSLASKPSSGASTASSDKKLPDTFHGCKIILPDSTSDYKKLKRYIIAFDGDLLPDYETHAATHIVASNMSEVTDRGKGTQLVKPEWLWKCIKAGRLVSTDAYRPT